MISLRKAMQAHVEESLQSALGAYRAALLAIGKAGVKACPAAGEQFQQALLALHVGLTTEAQPHRVLETEQRLEAELETWGSEAARFFQDKTNDVKDILSLVAKAAADLGERDQRYAKQFGQLTARLRATTQLNDLTEIRQSLTSSVADLNDCVTNMARDGRDSVAQMRSQLASYETRLEEVQRIASVDPLTGLFNRRELEARLERQIEDRRGFSVIYLDLNGFKQLNDTLGHSAGDDLLKLVAGELRNGCRATDIVGRWGGDGFLVIAENVADSRPTDVLLERIERWVAGEYSPSAAGALPAAKSTSATKSNRVKVSCAAGVATWQPGDTLAAILHRADAAMYERKARMKMAALNKLPVTAASASSKRAERNESALRTGPASMK